MTNYSTITDGNSSATSRSDMPRSRRRGGKDGGHGGRASTVSSIVNLLNTIVGAGTLAMPSVLSHMGIMLGVVLVLWSGLTAAFGLYLQSKCARYLERGSASFFALSQITYSQASVIFDAAIAIKCFGVGVSYMIIIGDLMPGVMLGFNGRADQIPYLVDRHFWITAFMLLVIPLSFLRRLDSLKYTSLVALVSIGYLIVLVIYHFAVDPHADSHNIRVIKWAGAVETLSALPIVVFAYTCHQNMFSIVNEIKDNTPSSIVRVVIASIGSAASIYILVAVTGYITFGNDIVGNIVLMYPTGVASTVGKAAIVILVLFSIPLQVHPCRASLDAVLRWRPSPAQPNIGRPDSSGHGAAAAPRGDHGATAPMSDTRFALLTTFILTLAYFTALSVSSLDRVLAFVGSTGSTSISFILPGLFYYKISDPDSPYHQRLLKEDDDMEGSGTSDMEESAPLAESSIRALGGSSTITNASPWRWRRKWRWDLEHLDHGLVRRLALALAVYGVVVMVVCLIMNIFFAASH
ncbi:uncharacterized protein UV8b_02321 [Ustilaginoidea virens]|uniref:Amino acid transporter transmembrane domain-containing protein n=1 Tax=Ustilaginoidea virens TaxID=1159556 RepID=A0A8E5HMA1_USTVR|nr:uncharacterized protein UV8b_02321 [Ustilaginoidea virens]QUC18080.1 hypothetical protein UV8b_02321 [Ustilaginoidea virens]